MRILFDQGTPVPLRLFLPSHSVETVFERGWQMFENGQLLEAAEREGFETLVTTDQHLRYQQNLEERKIAIVVLLSTSWPRIRQHTEEILGAVEDAFPGAYIEIPIS